MQEWLSGPISLAIPNTPNVWVSRPHISIINGEIIVAIGYVTNFGGEVPQTWQAEDFSFNYFGKLTNTFAATSLNATNPSEVPGVYTGATGQTFGGAYGSKGLNAWLSTSSATGAATTIYYDIYTQDAQGGITATTAQVAFSGINLPLQPATTPASSWAHLQSASVGNGSVAVMVDGLSASNLEQLNLVIINGAGSSSSVITFSDPNWTAGKVYSWSFGTLFSTATNYSLLTEDLTGSGVSQVASIHLWSVSSSTGAATSTWTFSTGFQSIDTIEWSWNSANTAMLADLSGTTSSGYQHRLEFLNGSTGAQVTGGLLVESYTGTVKQVARIVGLGSAVGHWLEYWVDGNGLTLEEVGYVNSQLTVLSTRSYSAANGVAQVNSLGDGRAIVSWRVSTGDVTTAGSTATDYFDIYDFRSSGLNGAGIAINGSIAGTVYNDIITHTTGTLTIDGGFGYDQYSLSAYASTQVTITHNSDGSTTISGIPDGSTDTLYNVERVNFSDISVNLRPSTSFTNDGNSDVLLNNGVYVGAWELHNGVPTWSYFSSLASGWQVVGAGDFDGNGTADVLLDNASTGQVGVWLINNNTPTWSYLSTMASGWSVAGVGDFNGDGVSDVLLENISTGVVGTWETINNTPTWAYFSQEATGWHVAGVGDFNGDGVSDVLLENSSTGVVGTWEITNNTPTWAYFSQEASGWHVAGVGDFNADGVSDVLLENSTTGIVGAWEIINNTPSWVYFSQEASGWHVAGVGDYNGDGRSDVLLENAATGITGMWAINNNLPTWQYFSSASSGWSVK